MYSIAYLDINGKGFDATLPYIYDDIISLENGKDMAKHMVDDGYCQVTLFRYDEELPEFITWDFINSHIVND